MITELYNGGILLKWQGGDIIQAYTKDLHIFAEYFFRNNNVRLLEKRKMYCRYTHMRIAPSLLFLTTVGGARGVMQKFLFSFLQKEHAKKPKPQMQKKSLFLIARMHEKQMETFYCQHSDVILPVRFCKLCP